MRDASSRGDSGCDELLVRFTWITLARLISSIIVALIVTIIGDYGALVSDFIQVCKNGLFLALFLVLMTIPTCMIPGFFGYQLHAIVLASSVGGFLTWQILGWEGGIPSIGWTVGGAIVGAFLGIFGPQQRKVEYVAVGIPLGAVVGYIEMTIYVYSVAYFFGLPL